MNADSIHDHRSGSLSHRSTSTASYVYEYMHQTRHDIKDLSSSLAPLQQPHEDQRGRSSSSSTKESGGAMHASGANGAAPNVNGLESVDNVITNVKNSTRHAMPPVVPQRRPEFTTGIQKDKAANSTDPSDHNHKKKVNGEDNKRSNKYQEVGGDSPTSIGEGVDLVPSDTRGTIAYRSEVFSEASFSLIPPCSSKHYVNVEDIADADENDERLTNLRKVEEMKSCRKPVPANEEMVTGSNGGPRLALGLGVPAPRINGGIASGPFLGSAHKYKDTTAHSVSAVSEGGVGRGKGPASRSVSSEGNSYPLLPLRPRPSAAAAAYAAKKCSPIDGIALADASFFEDGRGDEDNRKRSAPTQRSPSMGLGGIRTAATFARAFNDVEISPLSAFVWYATAEGAGNASPPATECELFGKVREERAILQRQKRGGSSFAGLRQLSHVPRRIESTLPDTWCDFASVTVRCNGHLEGDKKHQHCHRVQEEMGSKSISLEKRGVTIAIKKKTLDDENTPASSSTVQPQGVGFSETIEPFAVAYCELLFDRTVGYYRRDDANGEGRGENASSETTLALGVVGSSINREEGEVEKRADSVEVADSVELEDLHAAYPPQTCLLSSSSAVPVLDSLTLPKRGARNDPSMLATSGVGRVAASALGPLPPCSAAGKISVDLLPFEAALLLTSRAGHEGKSCNSSSSLTCWWKHIVVAGSHEKITRLLSMFEHLLFVTYRARWEALEAEEALEFEAKRAILLQKQAEVVLRGLYSSISERSNSEERASKGAWVAAASVVNYGKALVQPSSEKTMQDRERIRKSSPWESLSEISSLPSGFETNACSQDEGSEREGEETDGNLSDPDPDFDLFDFE